MYIYIHIYTFIHGYDGYLDIHLSRYTNCHYFSTPAPFFHVGAPGTRRAACWAPARRRPSPARPSAGARRNLQAFGESHRLRWKLGMEIVDLPIEDGDFMMRFDDDMVVYW